MEELQNRILVIKLGALGDFIQALGPMAAIRKHHPEAHITILTTKLFENFANECGYFDEILIDTKPKWYNLPGWGSLKKKLNAGNFNRIYDLQNNDRTSFYFKLFHRKPEWVGVVKGASHRNTSPNRAAGHAFDGHVQTLALAGIEDVKIDTLDWMDANISTFSLQKPYVIFVPGSAPNHLEKRWPAEKYGRLANILNSDGFQPIIIGSETEEHIAKIIKETCPEALDLTGQTSLQHIATLARNAAGAIGNDTGPMHLIAATSCPCVVLFSGFSNPEKHTPKGADVQILQRDKLEDLKSEEVLEIFKTREEPAKSSATTH